MRKPKRPAALSVFLTCWLAVAAVLLVGGCAPDTPPPVTIPTAVVTIPAKEPLTFSGDGEGEVWLDDWQGPGVLRLTAGEGSQPFTLSAASGLDFTELARAAGAVDTYRGIAVTEGTRTQLKIAGDRAWTVEVLPLEAARFDTLKVPGTFEGQGDVVIVLDGKHGVAVFDTGRAEPLTAWAIGESQKWEQLKINGPGDYAGKAVLPIQTRAMIVSAGGHWSVLVQEPCCEKPDLVK